MKFRQATKPAVSAVVRRGERRRKAYPKRYVEGFVEKYDFIRASSLKGCGATGRMLRIFRGGKTAVSIAPAENTREPSNGFRNGSVYEFCNWLIIRCNVFTVCIVILSPFHLSAGTPKIAAAGSDKMDFGKYPANERKEAVCKIINNGDDVLKIINIRNTCACAETICDKKELKPGEIADLKTVVFADSIYGGYSKNIYIETNDPSAKYFSLPFRGNAVPLIVVKPMDRIYAGNIPTGKAWKQESLTWTKINGVELEFTNPSPTGNSIPVKTRFSPDFLKKLSEKGKTVLTIITPGTEPADLTIQLEDQ